jgi:hypothetical protein
LEKSRKSEYFSRIFMRMRHDLLRGFHLFLHGKPANGSPYDGHSLSGAIEQTRRLRDERKPGRVAA